MVGRRLSLFLTSDRVEHGLHSRHLAVSPHRAASRKQRSHEISAWRHEECSLLLVCAEANMIRKLKSGEYRLYSKKKDPKTGKRRNLGTFKTREAAEKHEREVQYFKRH